MEFTSLEQIIRRHIPLSVTPSSQGWYSVLCKVCNDHGNKGDRAGFKFEDGTVIYHCFNCGHSTGFDPAKPVREGQPLMPPKMVQVLQNFGVPDEEWQQVLFDSLANKYTNKHQIRKQTKQASLEPNEIPQLSIFYNLKDATPSDQWAPIANKYLLSRGVSPDSYPFMMSERSDDIRLRKWFGRVIIPVYKGKKLIFYTGRDLTGRAKKKYESPPTNRDKVIFGYDRLFETTEAPLLIVEGWFDAVAVDGVALFGNEISKTKINILDRSPRKKVYIPDQFGDGYRGAYQALEAGWSISTPEIGDCKDMSEAVQTYGKMYVLKSITDHIAVGFQAEINIGIYCK